MLGYYYGTKIKHARTDRSEKCIFYFHVLKAFSNYHIFSLQLETV